MSAASLEEGPRRPLLHPLKLTGAVAEPDMSIWEVRNKKQHFTYSRIMLWVALDRGLRLADKRCLPCPNRSAWMKARDDLYEEIMEKGLSSPSLNLFPPFLLFSGSSFCCLVTRA